MSEQKMLSRKISTAARYYKQLTKNYLRAVFGRSRGNYIVKSPPWSHEQTITSFKSRNTFHFEVRDNVDLSVLNQIFAQEDYNLFRLARARELFQRYEQIVQSQKQPLIVDCGANVGFSAAYFADLFPNAKIVAIEPDEENCRLARRNCTAGNIDILQAAIASENKVGVVVDPGLGGWGYRVEEREDGGLRMLSINSLLEDPVYSACEPFIVKIDIEGFEKELFSKNTEWVDNFALLIIELHDWMLPRERNSENFLSTVANLDRDFVYIGENVFSISNQQFCRSAVLP